MRFGNRAGCTQKHELGPALKCTILGDCSAMVEEYIHFRTYLRQMYSGHTVKTYQAAYCDRVMRHILKHGDYQFPSKFRFSFSSSSSSSVNRPPQFLPFCHLSLSSAEEREQEYIFSLDVWDNKRSQNRSKTETDPLHEQNFRL